MVQRQQQSQLDSGPFTEFRRWRDVATGISSLCSLPVRLPLRKDTGYRELSLGRLVGITGLLWGLNEIGNWHVGVPLIGNIGAAQHTESLRNFGFGFLGYGLWERHRRWKDLLAGKLWHTRSRGVSRCEFLMPMIRRDLIYRNIDPAVGFVSGLMLRKLSFSGLGLFVMFSSVCWRLLEERAHEIGLDTDLDVVDGLVESKVQGETLAYFEGQGEVKARSLSETGGIATGVDANLEAQIARRKKEAATSAAGREVRS